MFFDDRKKAVATIMAKRKLNGEPMAGAQPMKAERSFMEDGAVDGRHAAAEDMMSAFHERSAHKMKAALSNFMDIHNSIKKSESPSDDAGMSADDMGIHEERSGDIFPS